MSEPALTKFRELFRWPWGRERAIAGDSVIDETSFGLHILYPEGENSTATQQQLIDIVAVHGLGGHAMNTWTHASTGKLWLRDFLPLDIPNARIMTFGYDARVMASRNILGMMENANSLLTSLRLHRSSQDLETRPLIFIGHSLGGLIIKKALIMAREANAHRQILEATHSVVFMGVPHDGADTANLANRIVNVAKLFCNLNRTTLKALRRDSRELQEISLSFSYLEGFDIITVMESERTSIPGTTKSKLIVPQTSARLNLGNREEWFNIAGADHHGVCKFGAENNAGYMMVREGLRKQVAKLPYPVTAEMLLFALDRVGPDLLLRHLPAVSQEDPKSRTLPSHEMPKFYWILKNMDFERWQSTNGTEVLWISGPASCRIPDASSYIVDLAMKVPSEAHSVLYFFCSTAPTSTQALIAITFISTIIHQLICSLPRLKQQVTTVFLRTLLDTILRKEPITAQEMSRFKRDDSVDATVKKILKATGDGYWGALRKVMNIERHHGVSLIIDGLDKTDQEQGFVREVCAFIEDLQERPSTTRVLLTSRPQAAIKEILSGLLCIEYDKERKECLNSLRFDNTRYEKISEQHEGSLEWLWTHEKYLSWSSTNTSDLLLIEGKPGSGKSTLMKYFQRSLMERGPAERRIVASFYYSYREGEQQTNHSNMLRSVLYDVLDQNEEFFFHFQPYYRQSVNSGKQSRWSYTSLKKVLLSFTKNHPTKERLYLVVDAIDESDDGERYDVIKLLQNLCTPKGPCMVKVFVASRPVVGLSGLSAMAHKMIRLQDVNYSDIVKFAESFLGPDLGLPPDTVDLATKYIVENAQGVFVWVRLVREELIEYERSGCSKNEIFGFLESLPTELEEFYKRILVQLEKGDAQKVKIGQRMLQFVLFTFRPLRLEELRQALAIRDSHDATFSFSDESFEGELIHGIEKRIISCAGNFLEIKGSRESSTVQVMHQTVPEFFRPSGPTAQTRFPMSGGNAHLGLAIICIRYLILCSASTSLAGQPLDITSWTSEHFEAVVQYLNQRPFITYALSYLEKHVRRCGEDGCVSRLISRLYEQLTDLKNPASYIFGDWVPRNLCQRGAAEKQWNSDGAKEFRVALLHTATDMQYSRVVEALLVIGVEVEGRKNGKTPLILSAERGDYSTTRILLDHEASIGAEDSKKRRAFHLAAANGHIAVVGLLIDRGVDKEAKDENARTALHLAAENGHPAVVGLLIDQGAEKEAEDHEGQTGLHLAAGNGHNPTVRLLVERGANKEAKDILGWQALHTAAWKGHGATIEMLIQAIGAGKEAKDKCGWTALHVAAMSGHDATIQMLVEKLGANKKAKDLKGWTALHFVAAIGLKDTTQLLIKTLNMDKKVRNKDGETALKLAQEM